MNKPLQNMMAIALVLAVGTLASAHQAAAAAPKPVLTIAFAGYDRLLSDLKAIDELSGHKLRAKAEAADKSLGWGTGWNSPLFAATVILATSDTSRPCGVLVSLDQNDKPIVQGYLPVKDFKGLLLLGDHDPDAAGVYTLSATLLVKQKGTWAVFANSREALDSAPDDLTPAIADLTQKYLFSVRGSMQNVPEAAREAALKTLRDLVERGLAIQQDPVSEEARALQAVCVKQIVAKLEKLSKELDTVDIGVGLDPSSKAIFLDCEFRAVAGSDLARKFAALNDARTDFAGLALPDAALTILSAATFDDEVVADAKAILASYKAFVVKGLDDNEALKDKRVLYKKLLGDLLDVVEKTVELKKLDGGLAIVLDDAPVIIAGLRIAEGKKLERTIKKYVNDRCADEPGLMESTTLDAEKYEGVNFHVFKFPDSPPQAVEVFGGPIQVVAGVSPSSLYAGIGKEPVGTIKKAIAASKTSPQKAINPVEMVVSATRVAKFFARVLNQENFAKAAASLAKSGGKDHVTLTVKAIPNGLTVRLNVESGVTKSILDVLPPNGPGDADEPAPPVAPNKEISLDLGNGVKLEMVLIPAGEFLMGSPDSGPLEKPHQVRITRPFYLGKHLVTQEQWESVVGSNPSHFKGAKNPVEQVSWDDCQEFLRKLAEWGRRAPHGALPAGKWEFRLPTEAQWEYACRAGSTTRFHCGDDYKLLGEYGWHGDHAGKTHPVGEKKPNAWGLYDMHGNVAKWCQDWFDDDYYARSPKDDPRGPATGSERVIRGGGYKDISGCCGSPHRHTSPPGSRSDDMGLRVALVPDMAVSGEGAPTPQPFRLKAIGPQAVEPGKTLNFTATVENAEAWKGKLRYSLGRSLGLDAPAGATIDPENGMFTWTLPGGQKAGNYNLKVWVEGPDGQCDRTTFVATVKGPEIAVDLGSGVNLEMVPIPAGGFMMGSPDSDRQADRDEWPQHQVRISKPFYLGKYPVTQEQWESVMGNNPSTAKGAKYPVETVSWHDCQKFLKKLNERIPRPGVLPAGPWEFRLPTEAQWEYACRAGSTTKYCFGNDVSKLGEFAWYDENSGDRTHPVGDKASNAWGLYDMHGNVYEWCQDWYDHRYYARSATDDPTGPAMGSDRVRRGGSFHVPASRCRSPYRGKSTPDERYRNLGFRVALVPADK